MSPSPFIIAPWSQPNTVSRLVTPPTEEPLTVEEVKLRAAMSWPTTDPPDPRDGLIADFIRTARSKVETDTGLALLTQEREVTFGDGPDYGVIPLPSNCLPVQSLQDTTPVGARVVPTFGLVPGTGRRTVTGVSATPGTVLLVTCGWPTVDDLKAEAPMLHQAVGLLASHYATVGRDLAITGAGALVNLVPEGYDALIQPYRTIWII